MIKQNKAISITELNVEQEQRINSILLIWGISTSALCIVFAACLIWFVMNNKNVDVRILTLDNASNQLVEVKKLSEVLKASDVLTRSFGEKVIMLKNTIDHQAEPARIAELGRYMTQEMCDQVNKDFDLKNADSFYSKMKEKDIYRQVKVTNVAVLNKEIEPKGNIIRVEWTCYDRTGEQGEVFQQQDWISMIIMDIRDVDFVTQSEARDLGFHLIGFVATKIQNSEKI